MKRHLTQRELIEYQFKLVSDKRLKEITNHLESCPQCREDLERLKCKFSALELLREEAKVSQDLTSRVIKQAQLPVRTKIISFDKLAWFGAVAAVLLVGFFIMVSHSNKQTIPKSLPDQLELSQKIMSAAEEIKSDVKTELLPARGLNEESSIVYRPSSIVSTEEQPPFAPASAIELVVIPKRESVQLTIYNSADLTLVQERRNLTLKQGWNWLQFMWANTLIDPTSLSLEPLEYKDKIYIPQLVFPARLRELGRWLIRSEVTGQVPFEITYFTSGLTWRAFYMGTLAQDERTMHLDGYVRVANNSGEDYENAQTRLIVGKMHLLNEISELAKRQYPYNKPEIKAAEEAKPLDEEKQVIYGMGGYGGGFVGQLEQLKPKEIKKEGLSEYFLYTIEGTETIPDKWGKRLLSFQADNIPVKSLYKYDEERFGKEIIRYISFANDKEHNLGNTPIPDGSVKIYSTADEQGYLSYVGGMDIKYIPVNEEIELNLGPARLVSVEPVLMNYKKDNFVFNRKRDITGWDEIQTWKIEVTNTRNLPIEIEITRRIDALNWTLQTEMPYEKHDARRICFKVNLEPRSKRTFEYTVRMYHGTRAQR